jgi:arsenate reductase
MSYSEPFKILFLCTGNSARSIFGEYIIRKVGGLLFGSYSAGAHPVGRVNPFTLRVLQDVYCLDASDARSKGFEEFVDVEFDS